MYVCTKSWRCKEKAHLHEKSTCCRCVSARLKFVSSRSNPKGRVIRMKLQNRAKKKRRPLVVFPLLRKRNSLELFFVKKEVSILKCFEHFFCQKSDSTSKTKKEHWPTTTSQNHPEIFLALDRIQSELCARTNLQAVLRAFLIEPGERKANEKAALHIQYSEDSPREVLGLGRV